MFFHTSPYNQLISSCRVQGKVHFGMAAGIKAHCHTHTAFRGGARPSLHVAEHSTAGTCLLPASVWFLNHVSLWQNMLHKTALFICQSMCGVFHDNSDLSWHTIDHKASNAFPVFAQSVM